MRINLTRQSAQAIYAGKQLGAFPYKRLQTVDACPAMGGKEGFMHRFLRRLCFGLLLAAVFTESGFAQKALTWQEIRERFQNQQLAEAARAQVFGDVDSAYATVVSSVILLMPYRDRYLQQASSVRDTIAFSCQHGAASLLDFLNAQADYRSVQVNFLKLIASYLNAANPLNLAVGREVIP